MSDTTPRSSDTTNALLRKILAALSAGSGLGSGSGGQMSASWPAALFFPGSAEITPEGVLRIAGGLNDHKAVQCEIPLEGILREM